MRPSRLVTYQVCRPGEGSVPGRPGLVVAVGTVTAAVSAMATMTAAMTAAVVVAHAVAHHTVAHHAAAGLDTEFLFHLVAEGHAFGAELGAEFRHLHWRAWKWSRAWRWGCGTGRRARCPWRSACPESGIRGCSNPSSWHHRHPAFREKPRTSRRGCHSCGTRCRRKRTRRNRERWRKGRKRR